MSYMPCMTKQRGTHGIFTPYSIFVHRGIVCSKQNQVVPSREASFELSTGGGNPERARSDKAAAVPGGPETFPHPDVQAR